MEARVPEITYASEKQTNRNQLKTLSIRTGNKT